MRRRKMVNGRVKRIQKGRQKVKKQSGTRNKERVKEREDESKKKRKIVSVPCSEIP